MIVRVTYRVERFVQANDLKHCKETFENLHMDEEDFVELCSVEDAFTNKDLLNEWNQL